MPRSAVSRRQFLTASAALAAGAALGSRAARACLPPPDEAALVAGNTRFGLELYDRLRREPGNLFLSPFSISAALAMTAAGARGKTLDEMTDVLHLPAHPHPAFRGLLHPLTHPPARSKADALPFDLSVANAIWAQRGYPWRPEFKQTVADNYAAEATDLDFVLHPEPSRETINAWVSKQTREKVNDLIPEGLITRLTRMVLTNAIHFKGQWAAKFDKAATTPQPFRLAGGGTAEVPLMHRVGSYLYAERDAYQVIEMPYVGDRISMVVMLPGKPDGLPAVETGLTADRLNADLSKLRREEEVHLHLPRFEAEKAFLLKDPLVALGMTSAFGAADFSGMHSGGGHLTITEVVHKAVVEVDEEGTTAAAGTAVIVGRPAAAPPTPKHVRVDRPFLFLLRDAVTGTVLFLGRVTDPRG